MKFPGNSDAESAPSEYDANSSSHMPPHATGRADMYGGDRTCANLPTLPDEARRSADPLADLPELLARNARAAGIKLDDGAWVAMDDDQR